MLVSRFSGVPSTLTHGDLDDRNIGLSWDSNAEGELVLIDWERLGRGPAAMDVAKLLILMPMLCEPGKPYPEVYWSDELPDFYYESYHQAGGKKMDIATWRRSYDLALITETLWPFPWALGNLMRTFRGEIPLSEIPGLPEAEARIQQASNLENLNHTVELVMGAINRVMN
jgi:aminoglycoside phosphotransferase (APT) family kinase protein